MNFDEILAMARSACACFADAERARVLVSSTAGELAGEVFGACLEVVDKNSPGAAVIKAGSFGYYDLEPIVSVERPGQPTVLYANVTGKTASVLAESILVENDPRPDLAWCTTGGGVDGIPSAGDLALFRLQERLALRNCGIVDPESIAHYIVARGGYRGLAEAVKAGGSAAIDRVRTSGLRGRGGAGYLTADKWQAVNDAGGSDKYVICNAIDGDRHARTAALLLESDPHAVLEGMLIAAYAVGASRCILCIADNSAEGVAPLLESALGQMKAYGLLGAQVLDSGFECEIEIRQIARSLVSGEETALLRSLQEKQTMASIRPPYPADDGFEGKPTLINSIETLANVSALFQGGPERLSQIGSERSPGTKVVTLAGNVVHPYTIEVPFGTRLDSLVQEIGEAKKVGAVQFGGPTGVFFGGDALDVSIDYETMRDKGAIIGSGTVEVFAEERCAVETTETVMSYLHEQSCGKCVFCREGTLQMADILHDICSSEGKPQDLDLLAELGEEMRIGCVCNLGRNAPNPLLSSLKLFRKDYDAHLKEKKCPKAG